MALELTGLLIAFAVQSTVGGYLGVFYLMIAGKKKQSMIDIQKDFVVFVHNF